MPCTIVACTGTAAIGTAATTADGVAGTGRVVFLDNLPPEQPSPRKNSAQDYSWHVNRNHCVHNALMSRDMHVSQWTGALNTFKTEQIGPEGHDHLRHVSDCTFDMRRRQLQFDMFTVFDTRNT